MKMKILGRTNIRVPEICLGTMTWGSQNTEAEGHAQMDYALGHSVNFFDAAEMYPSPPKQETQGRTEEIIGTWFKARGNRDKVVLATKVSGAGHKWLRDGGPITSKGVFEAVEGSLKRLQCDYIDLYQLHWPNRGSYHFRQSWTYDPTKHQRNEVRTHVEDVLGAMGRLVEQGKVRSIGLSNETAWGTAQFLELAQRHNLPRVASIQNEYSLMQRIYDLDLAELSHYENVGLLAFSPLAAGLLSGKYRDGTIPEGSRRSFNPTLGGRVSEYSMPVVEKYTRLAESHCLIPAQMAIAFCLTRPFVTSAIIGATSMDQLKVAIAAAEISLSDDVLAGIAEIHRAHPIPM